jgi:3-oxoacyl-[acyl-carrier protein] reductase
MAIDADKARAYRFDPVVVPVERGRLALFARVTGQADPVYSDLAAAKAAGHPDLPVPPTFFFGLELETPAPFGYLGELGIDLRQVLHGKQSYRYHALAHAGDTLTLTSRITSVVSRRRRHRPELRGSTDMGKLDGKVAIVTGAGRGIGAEIARKLAGDGAAVVVNDLDEGPAKETVTAITAAGGRAVACAGSVTEAGFAERFTGTAVDSFGGLDIIVNNAGYTWDSVIQKMSDEQWDAILDVHLKAPFRILRAAQPVISGLVKQARAGGQPVPCRKVVNISSIAGLGGNAGQANYAAAKAGITGLTRALAKEWGRYNVTVNTVAFGLIKTRLTEAPAGGDATIDVQGQQIKVGVNPGLLAAMEQMIPLGRAGTPADAAGAVYLLCIPESDYVSAQTLICGGGFFG